MIGTGAGPAWDLNTAVLWGQWSHATIVQSTGQGRRSRERIKGSGTGNFHDTATSHFIIGIKSEDRVLQRELLV
jgi:uncharacterized protein (DUF1501 family)